MIDKERRKEIKNKVLSALYHYNKYSFPVDIMEICKSYNNIRVIPFSVQIKRRNITYDEMCTQCQTDDACADYYANHDAYIIYYNDIAQSQFITSNRYRWSIAHELGHIMLEHHKNNDKTRIFRNELSSLEYSDLEEEADYFASLILVPYAAIIAFGPQTKNDFVRICQISKPAGYNRKKDYDIWIKSNHCNDEYDKQIFRFYYEYIYKKQCSHCKSTVIQGHGDFCPICGSKNTLRWGNGKMIYPKMKSYENGKLLRCPICDNEETNNEGLHCQICGIMLKNFCTNYNPENEFSCNQGDLSTNARYCPICGGESTFYRDNILKHWEAAKHDELFKMPIIDGIDEELPFN